MPFLARGCRSQTPKPEANASLERNAQSVRGKRAAAAMMRLPMSRDAGCTNSAGVSCLAAQTQQGQELPNTSVARSPGSCGLEGMNLSETMLSNNSKR
jgi:hypothetical protein